jgi:hypothetical protein
MVPATAKVPITREQVEAALTAWIDHLPPELAPKIPALAEGLADLAGDGDASAKALEAGQLGEISAGILQIIAKAEVKDRAIHKVRLDGAVRDANIAWRHAADEEIRLQAAADDALKAERAAIDRERAAE